MKNQHTHEVWVNKSDPNAATQTVSTGTYVECFQYVDKLAKEKGFGAGLLLTNGNYDIISVAQEAKEKTERAAPEMLAALLYYRAGIDNFYNCLDFGKCNLNAEAITFMNEVGISINAAVKSAQ